MEDVFALLAAKAGYVKRWRVSDWRVDKCAIDLPSIHLPRPVYLGH